VRYIETLNIERTLTTGREGRLPGELLLRCLGAYRARSSDANLAERNPQQLYFRAVCGCAVYILSFEVFRLYSRFELTVLLETCSPTGFSACVHGY